MLESAEYRRHELLKPSIFRKLASILGLSEDELKMLDFNIAENKNEHGVAYSIVLFFDANLSQAISNKIIGIQKENVVVITVDKLGIK